MTPEFQLFTSLRYDPFLATLKPNTEAWDGDAPSGVLFSILPYHRDRILQAAEHYGWATVASRLRGPSGLAHLLAKLTEALDTQSSQMARITVLLNQDGDITLRTVPVNEPVSQFDFFPTRLPPPQPLAPVKVSPLTGGALMVGEGDAVHGDPKMVEPWIVVPDPGRTTPSSETTYKTTSRDMYVAARERASIISFNEKKEVLIISDKNEIMEGSLTSVFFWRHRRWTTPPISSGGQMGTSRRWALDKGLCVEGVVKANSLVDGEECWISNAVRGFIWSKVRFTERNEASS